MTDIGGIGRLQGHRESACRHWVAVEAKLLAPLLMRDALEAAAVIGMLAFHISQIELTALNSRTNVCCEVHPAWVWTHCRFSCCQPCLRMGCRSLLFTTTTRLTPSGSSGSSTSSSRGGSGGRNGGTVAAAVAGLKAASMRKEQEQEEEER